MMVNDNILSIYLTSTGLMDSSLPKIFIYKLWNIFINGHSLRTEVFFSMINQEAFDR